MKIKKGLELKKGIYHNCSPRHYHYLKKTTREDGLEYVVPSKSMLSAFSDDPAKWRTDPPFKKSVAMTEGSLLDTMLLTPADLHKDFIEKPDDTPRRPTEAQRKAVKKTDAGLRSISFWDDFDKRAEGREIVSHQQMLNAKQGVKNLKDHKQCYDVIKNSHNQTVCIAEYRGFLVKGMFDLFPKTGTEWDDSIVDLKRTSGFTPAAFRGIVRAYKYHWQAALYKWLIKETTGEDRPNWRFMLSDSEKPFNCGMLRMHEDDVALGHKQVFAALDKYIDCVESDTWPNPYDGEEVVLKSFTY
jgi:hypothetical protein